MNTLYHARDYKPKRNINPYDEYNNAIDCSHEWTNLDDDCLSDVTSRYSQPRHVSGTNSKEVLDNILGQIRDLRDEVEEKPSEYAFAKAVSLIPESARLLSGEFPPAHVALGSRDDIRVYWIKPSLTLELTVPSDSSTLPSLYFRSPVVSRIIRDLDANKLAGWLRLYSDIN